MKKLFLTITLALFVIPFGISQDLPSYVPTDGLIAYYPFNGNANDESGNGNHGTVNGATLTSDRDGNENSSYSFDGIDDYIVLFENGEINFDATDSFSYSLWFKQVASTENSYGNPAGTILASKNNARNGTNITVGYPNNTVTFFVEGDQDLNNSVASSSILNHWVYLSFVYDSSSRTLKAFNNGSKVDELVVTESLVGDLLYNSMWIGRRTNYTPLNTYVVGSIDDIGIWNRVLTEQEIQNLYTSSTGDILLNGTVSAENNQIKNVADPTNAQDAVTLGLLLEKISNLQDQIDALQSTSGSGTVTDQDGNSYPYLTYGDQVWTVKNAEMVTYSDGTTIPQVTDATEWENLTTGAWCYYDNDASKGKLYNWYAVNGIHDNDENTPNKEFAPEGWHVPSDAEWTTLEEYLIANGYNYDGTTTENKIAKAMASTTGWIGSTTAGAPGNDQSLNNSSGFNAFPEGARNWIGFFIRNGERAYFWSSTENSTLNAWYRSLNDNSSGLNRGNYPKQLGFSVRFVRDETSTPSTETILPIILEPGFEDNSLPDGSGDGRGSWINSDLGGQLQITSTPVKEGSQASKYPSSGDRIAYQELNVSPNSVYTLSYAYTLKSYIGASITVSVIAGGGHTDLASALSASIESFEGTDQTNPDSYVLVSIPFNSGANNTVSILVTNQGSEARIDSFSIVIGD